MGGLISSLSSESSDSKSCSSSLTSHAYSEEIRKRKLRIISIAASSHEFKRQVRRRFHLNKNRNSNRKKSIPGKKGETGETPSGFESTKAVSCLSNSSAGESTARSLNICGGKDKGSETSSTEPGQRHVGSAHMRSRAEAILKFLASGSASEVRIRQVLGDSPDTSKALRMLLKLEEVKRSGTGGRQDPYLYMIAQQSVDPEPIRETSD